MENAEVVAWVCVGAGVFALLLGCMAGAFRTPATTNKKADSLVQQSKDKVQEASSVAQSQLAKMSSRAAGEGDVAAANAALKAHADAAMSSLDQLDGIVSSVSERTRFAGLLVLVGALLISVATIQFGGVSIF